MEQSIELYDINSEHALLGCLIKNNNNIDYAMTVLTEDVFYLSQHGKIYECIKNLILDGLSANPSSITNKLGSDEWFKELGGLAFAKQLLEIPSNLINFKTYCHIVKEKYDERRLQIILQDNISLLGKGKTKELKESLLNGISEACEDSSSLGGFAHISKSESIFDKSMVAYNTHDPITGLKTGFEQFDLLTSGLQGSKLYVLGASTGCGKSCFSFNIAYNLAKQGKKIAINSLEMTREEIKSRLISSHTGISLELIEKGLYKTREQMQIVQEAEKYIDSLPIIIDEQSGLHINQIRSRAISLKRKQDIDLLIIDHMHLVKANGNNKQMQMSEISMGLKNIAKELNIPVLSLAQLNRTFSGRINKRPVLSDLRDSGTIEQDSDMVLFLYREEYTLSNDLMMYKDSNEYKYAMSALLESKGLTELIVAKNRGGKLKNIDMIFDGRRFQFIETGDLVIQRGFNKKHLETVEEKLNEKFGDNWYSTECFNKAQNKVITKIRRGKAEEINNINENVKSNFNMLHGCSPIIIGAIAETE